jgi:hypothetical protein
VGSTEATTRAVLIEVILWVEGTKGAFGGVIGWRKNRLREVALSRSLTLILPAIEDGSNDVVGLG